MKTTLKNEFDDLKALIGTDDYEPAFEAFCKKYDDEPVAKKEIEGYIKEGMAAVGQRIERLAIRIQLKEIADMVSMSYIARQYFGKTKAWLYQRINANQVNGKPAQFSETEVQTLKAALQDIGKRIGSVSVHLH